MAGPASLRLAAPTARCRTLPQKKAPCASLRSDKDLEEQKRDPSDPVAFFESAALDFYEDDEPTNCLEIREGSFVELRDELIKGGVKLEPPKKRPFVAEVRATAASGASVAQPTHTAATCAGPDCLVP